MSTHRLPSSPNLDHLRNAARDLQRAVRAGEPDAIEEIRAHHPRAGVEPSTLRLADAQLVVARRHGFASWARLRRHLDTIGAHSSSPHVVEPDDPAGRFLALACLRYGNGDSPERWRTAADLLRSDPAIATASIWTMAAAGEQGAVRALLDDAPTLATTRGGPFGWTPILYAAFSRVPLDPPRSRLAAARLLIDHGADPNDGYLWEGLPSPFTALTGAFGGGEDAVNQPPHPDGDALARLLLERGADPNDNQVLYNRMFARSDDHLVLLFEHGLGRGDGGPWRARMPEATESVGATLAMQLQWAAEHDRVARVQLLLENGVDPDGRSGHPAFAGRRAIELAELNGNDEVVGLLAASGAAPVHLGAEEGLVAACLRADREAAEALIAGDPGLVGRAEAMHAPMVTAAGLGRIDALRLMVDLGFDVDARGRVAALHQAAGDGNLEVVAALLELGADPNLRDHAFDAPALGWARHNGHDDVAALLEPLTG